jgi:hypothetical protein
VKLAQNEGVRLAKPINHEESGRSYLWLNAVERPPILFALALDLLLPDVRPRGPHRFVRIDEARAEVAARFRPEAGRRVHEYPAHGSGRE